MVLYISLRRNKMLDTSRFVVLGGNGNHELDKEIIAAVNQIVAGGQGADQLVFSHLDGGRFADGESDLRIINWQGLAGKHLIVFQTTRRRSRETHELIAELLTMAWAAKYQYGALSVTAVVPFMSFRRQDHPENLDEIHRNRWLIHMMAACGIDRLVVCDIHSDQTRQNCEQEGIQFYNVPSASVFANHLRPMVEIAKSQGRKFFIYAPDAGAVPRAIALAKELGVGVTVTLKERSHDGNVEIKEDLETLQALSKRYGFELMPADERLAGASICLVDDELSTGRTASKTGHSLLDDLGVHEVFFCATHAVCADGWKRTFVSNTPFARIFLGNTVHRGYFDTTGGAITNVNVAQAIAYALLVVLNSIE